jgi:hypothetical protein
MSDIKIPNNPGRYREYHGPIPDCVAHFLSPQR